MNDSLLSAAAVLAVGIAWILLFAGAILILAYRRASLGWATAVLAVLFLCYWVFGAAPPWWKILVSIPTVLLLLLNIRPLRRKLVSRPFLKTYRRLLPSM